MEQKIKADEIPTGDVPAVPSEIVKQEPTVKAEEIVAEKKPVKRNDTKDFKYVKVKKFKSNDEQEDEKMKFFQ